MSDQSDEALDPILNDGRMDYLERELQGVAVEHMALVDPGPDHWSVRGPMRGDPEEVYDVDPANDTGPVVMVRRSDGVRFCVEVDVTVTPERSEHRGLTPEGGWPT